VSRNPWTWRTAIQAGTKFRLNPLQAASIAALMTVGRGNLSQWSYAEGQAYRGHATYRKAQTEREKNGRYWLRVTKGMAPSDVLALVADEDREAVEALYREKLQRLEALGVPVL